MAPQPEEPLTGGKTETPRTPTLAEDLLLLLVQPYSGLRSGTGTIAGENTLYYVLAGAVLADLALADQVRTEHGRMGATVVKAVENRPPADDIPRSAGDYVHPQPRVAALAALISGSGTLPEFDPEIPGRLR